MKPTILRYLDHGELLQDTATILDVIAQPDGSCSVILDSTIFYPQGGGQPYDQGTITGPSGIITVKEVRVSDGIVSHSGSITGTCAPHDLVSLALDKERREFNSRNHTAGHIIDIALRNCGFAFPAVRGYHFKEGAYCEYAGTLNEEERAALQKHLQDEVNRLVKQNLPVSIKIMGYEELKSLAGYVPETVAQGQQARAMIIEGYYPIPCGGTHAKTTDIGTLTIVKLRNKSGHVRISYDIT